MFTNLSNHPSSGWSKEQYSYASSRWGKIVDLPFPVLNPDTSEQEIPVLVRKYLELLPGPDEGPVFVPWEYTFTYAMAIVRTGALCQKIIRKMSRYYLDHAYSLNLTAAVTEKTDYLSLLFLALLYLKLSHKSVIIKNSTVLLYR